MQKTTKPKTATPVDGMSFEQALQELESIVERFESGEVSLDEAVAAYERGTVLKQHCQKRLDEAKMKVDAIRSKQASGQDSQQNNTSTARVDGVAPLDHSDHSTGD